MKMAFDLHGTMDSKPEFFKHWLSFLMKDHEVVVLSGPPKGEIFAELARLGFRQDVHYNLVISVVDFLQAATDCKMWQDDNDNWWADDCDWWSSKAKICEQVGIDTLVDDKEEYQAHFNGHGTLFWLWR